MQTNQPDSNSHEDALKRAAQQALSPWAHLPDGKKWCVALSGGADSTALLHVLKELAEIKQAQLCAAIVNHNLRPEAQSEAEQVQQSAQKAGIDAVILTISQLVPQAAIQEWARAKRYDALCRFAREKGCLLVFGHHQDDQNETIAMRLSHGSALRGLAAMAEVTIRQGVPIIRPFLHHPKSELYRYCEDNKLTFIEDPSNQKHQFERVRWRHLLSQDEALRANINQLGHLAHRLQQQLDKQLSSTLDQLIIHKGLWAEMAFDVFQSLSPEAQQHMLRTILTLIGGRDYVPSQTAQKQAVMRLRAGQTTTLGHVILTLSGDILHCLPEAGRPAHPQAITAGTDMIFEGRFLVRTAQGGVITRLSDDIWGGLEKMHPLRMQLKDMPAAVRRTFPVLRALDEKVMTTHIKGVTQIGHFTHMDWPTEGVDIYPLGRLARVIDQKIGLSFHAEELKG